MFNDFAAPKGGEDRQLWLKNGEPMLFANGLKGIALDMESLSLKVVDVAEGDWQAAGVLVHNVKNRSVAHMLIEKGWPLDDQAHAIEAARQVDLANLDKHALSAHGVGEAASRVAVIPELRRILVEKQRDFARQPGGAVLDGRDIGTVIAPDADVKLFVTATSEIRAERRFAELKRAGLDVHLPDVLADIRARDERDSGRAAAPLVMADDAILLDTSEMNLEQAIAASIAIVDARR